MKRFFFILLLSPMLCLGLHNHSPQQDEQDIQRIQEQIRQIDRDSSLAIETAWYHQGDGDFQYTIYRNADELVKLKRSLFVGGAELHQIVYFPNRPTPLSVLQISVEYADDDSLHQSEEISYYAEGKLLSVFSRAFTYGKYTSTPIPEEPWESHSEQTDDIFEENHTLILNLLTEIKKPTFLPAKLYTGLYTYAYDAEIFRECGTEKRYQIGDHTMRQAYIRLQPEVFEKVKVVIVATMDMQEDLSGKMTETLTMVDLISMEKE